MKNRGKRLVSELSFTEPDLMPILNICLMLILVILSLSSFVPLGFISSESPKLSNSAQQKAAAKNKSKALNLTVFVLDNAFKVSANGATRKIPKKNKAYDFASLTAEMKKLKKKHPKSISLFLAADPDVAYGDIIQTMDATRHTSDGKLLFPKVAFIAGITS